MSTVARGMLNLSVLLWTPVTLDLELVGFVVGCCAASPAAEGEDSTDFTAITSDAADSLPAGGCAATTCGDSTCAKRDDITTRFMVEPGVAWPGCCSVNKKGKNQAKRVQVRLAEMSVKHQALPQPTMASPTGESSRVLREARRMGEAPRRLAMANDGELPCVCCWAAVLDLGRLVAESVADWEVGGGVRWLDCDCVASFEARGDCCVSVAFASPLPLLAAGFISLPPCFSR